MSLITQLVGFALRQVIGDFGDSVVQVVGVVEQHFRDHSRTLPKALDHAHQRAWQALGVALAGDGLLDRVKVFFASGDDKGVRERVQLFLKSNAVSFDGTPADFRQDCLDELKRLRKSGLLSTHGGTSAEIARQAAGFRRHTDAQGLIEESRRAVAGVADALAEGYPNLAKLLRTPTPAGPPLLAAAFCYFFRREVETDDELAHGLFFDGLRQLSASQAKAFGEVGKALDGLGARFDQAINDVLEELERTRVAAERAASAAVATQVIALDMQDEQRRQGGMHLANAGEIRILREQVQQLLSQAGMARGEVRPGYSCSIRGEDERRAVKALLARFRQLPSEEQRQAPALLNGLGKLQVGAGDFAEARQTFTEVAQVVTGPSGKAEASFNVYRAALEEKKWDAALAALREAATHDPQRFAPFPLHRYEPKRILGAGGFGTAILCHDRNFDEDVVVKMLHVADLERGVDDVFREARILRRLSHPAIINVRDCEYADPTHKARPYLVMDYFLGGTLQQFVEQRGPLNLEQLLAVAVQVAEGMKAAHTQGVLHRDLKPANILVRKEGHKWKVKIIDFGLAMRQQTVETSRLRTGATEKSMVDSSVAGTLDYAPPEQLGKLLGVPPGPYSDVYAFARTCFYAMFKTTELRRKQWGSLPGQLADLLEGCLDPDPKQRPNGFQPVLEVLGVMANGHETKNIGETTKKATAPPKKPAVSPSTIPVLPPGSLKAAFDAFRASPPLYATVLLRRMRVKQLRALLAAPETIDLDEFNREVWPVVTSMVLDSKSVTPWRKGNQGQLIDDDLLPAFERALQAGTVKFQGNSIWGSGSRTYGPMLNVPEHEKTENIRRALRILNDPSRLPLQKARAIDEVPGFGENTATGLVMVYHTTEFAIYNKKSEEALKSLGYSFRDLATFEEAVQGLRDMVGATDFLELDWFLYLVCEGHITAP